MALCEQSLPYVRAISPYQPGKPITQLAREMGIAVDQIVKLASNENPLGMSPKARAAAEQAMADLSRYPDDFLLKQALAQRTGIGMERIVLGNGSNDVLDLVARVFLAPGRTAVFSQYAFAVYPLATLSAGAEAIAVPARSGPIRGWSGLPTPTIRLAALRRMASSRRLSSRCRRMSSLSSTRPTTNTCLPAIGSIRLPGSPTCRIW